MMDWIKVRIDLLDDPAVIMIAHLTGLDEYSVVGRLVKVWGWGDRQCTNGHAPGVTPDWIDRYVQHKGFADPMEKTGWIAFDATGAYFPNFDRHNGKSAKARAQGALRQQVHRSGDKKGKS